MTSAAVLFYGRRSRSSSRNFDDDLGFPPPTPPLSSSSSDSNHNNSNHHHRHRHRNKFDLHLHRRHRHINFDDPPSNLLHHSSPRSPLPGSESHQQCCDGESSSQDINNRETVHGLSGRYHRNSRLPGSVLLAKERLVQRLRGVSVTGVRESRETLPSLPSNDLWVVDADWETSVSREEPAPFLTELPAGAHQQSARGEPHMKPLGLSYEAFSLLHHEVFLEKQEAAKASNDCSICLESFVEGSKLINLHCGHRFHSSCLYPWLQTCGECPYCRSCIMHPS